MRSGNRAACSQTSSYNVRLCGSFMSAGGLTASINRQQIAHDVATEFPAQYPVADLWRPLPARALRVQRVERGGVVAELAQDFVGVLALVRGRAETLRLRKGAHMDRLADDVEAA